MPIACRNVPNIVPFDVNSSRFFVNLHAHIRRSTCQTAHSPAVELRQRVHQTKPVIHVTAHMVRRGLRIQQCDWRTTALPLFFACAQIEIA